MPFVSTLIKKDENVYCCTNPNSSPIINPYAIAGLSNIIVCNSGADSNIKEIWINGVSYENKDELKGVTFDIVFTNGFEKLGNGIDRIDGFTDCYFTINGDNSWNSIPIYFSDGFENYLVSNETYKCYFKNNSFLIMNYGEQYKHTVKGLMLPKNSQTNIFVNNFRSVNEFIFNTNRNVYKLTSIHNRNVANPPYFELKGFVFGVCSGCSAYLNYITYITTSGNGADLQIHICNPTNFDIAMTAYHKVYYDNINALPYRETWLCCELTVMNSYSYTYKYDIPYVNAGTLISYTNLLPTCISPLT